jgi:hypothetical protein
VKTGPLSSFQQQPKIRFHLFFGMGFAQTENSSSYSSGTVTLGGKTDSKWVVSGLVENKILHSSLHKKRQLLQRWGVSGSGTDIGLFDAHIEG